MDISSNSYGPITSWHWDFGDGLRSDSMNPVHKYEKDGAYIIRLTIENRYGCRDRHEEKVKIYPRPQSRFDLGTVCLDSLLPIRLRSKIDSGIIVARIWEPGDGNPPIQTSGIPAIRYHQPGSYLLRLIERSEQGCVDTFSLEIIVRPKTIATAGPDTSICYGRPLRLFAEGGYYFELTPPGQTANSSSVVFTPTKDTRYRVIVRDHCYADTAWVNVRVLPLPELEVSGDTGIFKGGQAILRAVSNTSNILWSPSFSLDRDQGSPVIARPDKSTTYRVKAISDEGCVNEKQIRVEVIPDCYNLVVPNAFSPNGDGNNDYFYPVNLGDAKILSLSVFNRWGEKIHYSEKGELAWDGRHNGRYSPPGNYVYEITLDCQGQTLRVNGHVLLLR
jgi:gliding motility-associated-like protein